MICPTCRDYFEPTRINHIHCSTWCGKRDRCKCGDIKARTSKQCRECKKLHSRHGESKNGKESK